MSQSTTKTDNAARSEIAQCARRMVDRDPALAWLPATIASRGINPSRGILAAYAEAPDRGGRLCSGTWLTATRDFWEFRVLVAAPGNDGPVVELFEERSVSVFAHKQGIGKSFGALAIEVLGEVLGTTPPRRQP